MKKRILTLFMLGSALMANAQQLSNGTFDATWVDCHPWEKGSFISGTQGKQPESWCISNVNGMGGLGATVVGSQGDNRVGGDGKSVVVTNTPNPLSSKQIVPGYFTLGTAWATAKATMAGSVTSGTADGGVFGGIAFTSKPDALLFYYKRAHNVNKTTTAVNSNEKASIVAYTWKGTWTQADVPSHTSMSNPTKVTMTDRANNILGKDCLTGGTITKTNDAELLSVIEYYISGDTENWTEMIIPFEYKNTKSAPEKLNIIFAANDLFADRSGIGAGNQLTVDDVQLLYWNTLSSLKFDNVELLAGESASFTVDAVYDAAKLQAVAKSQFAEVSTSYDETKAQATVTVTRENAETKTYTIQFKYPDYSIKDLAGAIEKAKQAKATKTWIEKIVDLLLGK